MASSSGRTSLVAVTSPSQILGRARFAEAEREAVFLPAVHDEGHGLGRLAERDGQHAARQRIERAAVACLLRAEQATHLADRRRRAQPDRLVEHDPAVDLVALSSARVDHAPARVYGPDKSVVAPAARFRQAATMTGAVQADRVRRSVLFGLVLSVRRGGPDLPDGLASAARPVRRRRHHRRRTRRRRLPARARHRQPGGRPSGRSPVAPRRPSRLRPLRGRHRGLRRGQSLALLRRHLSRAAAARPPRAA